MTLSQITMRIVFGGVLVTVGWFPAIAVHAAEEQSGRSTASSSERGLPAAASGSVEDTLKACLARIPKNASAGQQLMAEGSCEQDAKARKAIQAVPGVR